MNTYKTLIFLDFYSKFPYNPYKTYKTDRPTDSLGDLVMIVLPEVTRDQVLVRL